MKGKIIIAVIGAAIAVTMGALFGGGRPATPPPANNARVGSAVDTDPASFEDRWWRVATFEERWEALAPGKKVVRTQVFPRWGEGYVRALEEQDTLTAADRQVQAPAAVSHETAPPDICARNGLRKVETRGRRWRCR